MSLWADAKIKELERRVVELEKKRADVAELYIHPEIAAFMEKTRGEIQGLKMRSAKNTGI